MAEDLQKLKFPCPHCGCGLSVPADRAGKRGKCPRCKETLTVPVAPPPSGVVPAENGWATSPDSGPAELVLIPPVLDGTLLDLSTTETASPENEDQETHEQLRGLRGRYLLKDNEEVPPRRLPWIIDIFLYPFNTAGLTMLALCVGIPFVLRVMSKSLNVLCMLAPVALIVWVPVIIAHWTSLLLFCMYMNWYVCECIRDSACGGIRATETAGTAPGLWEILTQIFYVLACLLFSLSPALVYWKLTHRTDAALWTLYGVGAFLLPMGLLAVVMSESLRALNPIPLARSILSTFFQYCGLVVFYYAVNLLFVLSFYFILNPQLWFVFYLLGIVAFGEALVLAHLLGRFYWKHEERLYWDA